MEQFLVSIGLDLLSNFDLTIQLSKNYRFTHSAQQKLRKKSCPIFHGQNVNIFTMTIAVINFSVVNQKICLLLLI